MKRSVKSFPRIKMNPDGRVTLSGLMYNDLRSILRAASLYRYDHPFQPDAEESNNQEWQEVIAENNRVEKAWHAKQRILIDSAADALMGCINALSTTKLQTVQDRWREVREKQRSRKIIDEIFEEEIAKRKTN